MTIKPISIGRLYLTIRQSIMTIKESLIKSEETFKPLTIKYNSIRDHDVIDAILQDRNKDSKIEQLLILVSRIEGVQFD